MSKGELLEAEDAGRSVRTAGWTRLPRKTKTRWLIPRGPRRATASALGIYQPVTLKGLLGWEVARLMASCGLFRLFPEGGGAPTEVQEAIAPHVPPGGTLAVSFSNPPGRYVVFLMDAGGTVRAVAKVGTTPIMKATLAREAATLRSLPAHLPPPLEAPRMLDHREGLLLLELVSWDARIDPWMLPEEVAGAMGAFLRSGRSSPEDPTGWCHGDFAPWNLFKSARGWVVLDWEHAQPGGRAFFDMFHYVVMAHALLGKPSRQAILSGISGKGWFGRALSAYARAADLPLENIEDHFVRYVVESAAHLDRNTRDGRRGMAARSRLLSDLGHPVSALDRGDADTARPKSG
ncbi:MAG: phosphotransferase [Actinomycetota bacterium]